jgi:uncharacterized protein YodC (DUF2158 family)
VLISGGPKMAVDGVGRYGLGATRDLVRCTWFEKDVLKHGKFEIEALKRV